MKKIKLLLKFLEKNSLLAIVLILALDFVFLSHPKFNRKINKHVKKKIAENLKIKNDLKNIVALNSVLGYNEFSRLLTAYLYSRKPNNKVYIIHPIPFKKPSSRDISYFSYRIGNLSKKYVQYAKERGIKRELPFNRFAFKMIHEEHTYKKNKKSNKRVVGHCNIKENIIYLRHPFSEATFFHELGHCDLLYSHKEDKNVLASGKSEFIMNWSFNSNNLYNLKKKKRTLDMFFNLNEHNNLYSAIGFQSHLSMASQIEEYEDSLVNQKEK